VKPVFGGGDYKPECRSLETHWGQWIFTISLIFPAALGSGVYSACNRNECQKQKKNVSRVQPVHKTDSLSAICEIVV
jgi:hypothetical protein